MPGDDRRSRPPLPVPFGAMLEPLYRGVVGLRNRAFDQGRGVVRLRCPVISVGNLSVGGTGKTPLVMCIARWLIDAGRRPAIAMRGYGSGPDEPSDEQEEYQDRLPNVPVVARPDRVAGLTPLLASGLIDCVVLDDGFQHRRVARDLDIVAIDTTRSPWRDRCLPAGWLREPVESLQRADAFVLAHEEAVDAEDVRAIVGRLRTLRAHGAVARTSHEWESIMSGAAAKPVTTLTEQPIAIVCAIGNSNAFVDACRAAGAIVLMTEIRRDHHAWNAHEVRDIMVRAGAAAAARGTSSPAIVTTEKDWVRLRRLPGDVFSLPVLRPRLRLRFADGEDELRRLVLHATGAGASKSAPVVAPIAS